MRRVHLALRLSCLVLLAALIAWALIHRADFDRGALEARLQGLGPWAGPIFMLVYAAATILFVPGSLLSLGGGALFGPVWGTVYNLSGATVGATVAFLLARYLLGGWVERHSGSRLKRLADEVEAQGWRFAAFVRLVPLFPFNFLNYALGLTRIGLSAYVLTSVLCMIPGAIAYTYLGYVGREAFASGAEMVQKGMIALGLVAALVFLPQFILHLYRPASLKNWTQSHVP